MELGSLKTLRSGFAQVVVSRNIRGRWEDRGVEGRRVEGSVGEDGLRLEADCGFGGGAAR